MYLDTPPTLVESTIFTTMPESLRRGSQGSAWARANKPGQSVDSFIEGPAFDNEGNLYIVDLPFGRIFRITPDAQWQLVTEYDGEPNGLKFDHNGTIIVADYRRGLVRVDPATGGTEPLLERRNAESFKGVNDLTIASTGEIYFTDQGQTGLHDPTGRVYRLHPDGRLNCLMDNLPSPNGLVLDLEEKNLFVAMTRDNSVWRAPLTSTGGVSKVGRFCTMFGTSGPDGMAIDEQGRIHVAHASLGQVFVFAPNGECVARVRSAAGPTCTNVAFGGPDRTTLYITESSTGTLLQAALEFPGMELPRPPRSSAHHTPTTKNGTST
ncbi:SMP-30/gluconolactonase/LRE family protein [Arthrobacter sp. ISL-85]|uniref:SMP-30/gluconolactonase/LRE family protein n=1 Tax=Arthrobacter sp. ISL-85 TaxID=2819115 RepID=UPI001BEC20A3|nr:SMP-30/gluconolactonase/LRE family protein [Arthrobacter sp. ISL-85]MBT2565102.1 SMP-30/gluconolactonase/LRE family protein [Arthrobacter sp. ISL-85]